MARGTGVPRARVEVPAVWPPAVWALHLPHTCATGLCMREMSAGKTTASQRPVAHAHTHARTHAPSMCGPCAVTRQVDLSFHGRTTLKPSQETISSSVPYIDAHIRLSPGRPWGISPQLERFVFEGGWVGVCVGGGGGGVGGIQCFCFV